jgi:hypothetical protein
MVKKYQVVVGNVGQVIDTDNGAEANIEYGRWKAESQKPHGRCSGESVTLFKDGEPKHEYAGTLAQDGVDG